MTLAARQARQKDDQAPDPGALLAWYDRHRRRLPWRAEAGAKPDPYAVWLSEIMLQQTTVKAVAPYYARFLARWPTVKHLAAADREDVLKLWAGLGYYARARNLHACAQAVASDHGGVFPDTQDALRALPGIGAYTAAAIAAIAFERKTTPVDGNIERVIARLFAVEEFLPAAKTSIHSFAQSLTPARRSGDFAQAMMDLGATICTPKKPACSLCPWNDVCAAYARGDQETFPRKAPKAEGKLRRGAAFVAIRDGKEILARTRPDKGLLGGMTEVPTTEWTHEFAQESALARSPRFSSPLPSGERSVSVANRVRGRRRTDVERLRAPLPRRSPMFLTSAESKTGRTQVNLSSTGEREQSVAWRKLPGMVRHTFTHFPLELTVYLAHVPDNTAPPNGMRWIALEHAAGEAFPNVMRKVLAHALDHSNKERTS